MTKFPERLAAFPGLRQERWDLDMVRVAQDWALEQGYEPAEAWLKSKLSPSVVQAAMMTGVEPLSLSLPHRNLIELLGLDHNTACTVMEIIRGDVGPEEFESVVVWIRQCYNRPSRSELKMKALNEALGGFGVEAIIDDPSGDLIAEYINMGDTYAATIVRVREANDEAWDNVGYALTTHYYIASYGDVVEAWERAHLEGVEDEDAD